MRIRNIHRKAHIALAAVASAWLSCHGGVTPASAKSPSLSIDDPQDGVRALAESREATPSSTPMLSFVVPSLESRPALDPHDRKPGPGETKSLRFPENDLTFPARAYGALTSPACFDELDRRGVPYKRVNHARNVDAPIRLTGTLHGVDFHGTPVADRERSVHEILDCRLALALDDFSTLLADHGVVEAEHMSIYRPAKTSAPPPGKKRRTQHEAALAIDVGALIKADGTRVVIEEDWHGRIGARTCGEGAAPKPATEVSVELRDVLCTAVSARTFSLYLTPNHDVPHRNHFHLEVVRDAKWLIVE